MSDGKSRVAGVTIAACLAVSWVIPPSSAAQLSDYSGTVPGDGSDPVLIACHKNKSKKVSSAAKDAEKTSGEPSVPSGKSDEQSASRKVRSISAEKIDLIDGMPAILFWRSKSNESKASVLCLHELGMHGGVFDDLASKLSQKGYNVYAMDLRGFGGWSDRGSEGKMNLKNTLSDISKVSEAIGKREPGSKLFLLGEAMGGALALEAAAKFPDTIAGVISSAPGGEHFNAFQNYLSVGSRFTTGNKRYNKGEELMALATPKKELQQAFKNDSNVRLDLEPSELMTCQFYMYKTKRFARQIKDTPVMIVQGLKDGESKPEGAKRIFDNLGTKDRKYLTVEDGDHYVYEDTSVNDKALQETIAWLERNSGH